MQDVNAILDLIIGREKCEQLITQIVREYCKKGFNIDDFEYIRDAYFIVILIIGFSKKQVDIDKYNIHLIKKTDITVDIKDFCERYKKYIDEVEKCKFDLLRKII